MRILLVISAFFLNSSCSRIPIFYQGDICYASVAAFKKDSIINNWPELAKRIEKEDSIIIGDGKYAYPFHKYRFSIDSDSAHLVCNIGEVPLLFNGSNSISFRKKSPRVKRYYVPYLNRVIFFNCELGVILVVFNQTFNKEFCHPVLPISRGKLKSNYLIRELLEDDWTFEIINEDIKRNVEMYHIHSKDSFTVDTNYVRYLRSIGWKGWEWFKLD